MNRKPSLKHQASINKQRNMINRPSLKDSIIGLWHESYNNDTKDLEREFDKEYHHEDQ